MALGKGLSALITPTGSGRRVKKGQLANNGKEQIWQIPLSSVLPDPNQPRKHFDDTELHELAASIKEHGVLQPILVVEKADGGYEIISGERRWRACKIAEQADVPAIVKKIPAQQKLEISLIENIQRQDLNPLEEAFAYKRLMTEFDMSQPEVASKVGKARSTISNMIRMLELPEEVKNALAEKRISSSQARALLGLKTEKEQLEMLSSMLGGGITIREIEREASKRNTKTKGKNRKDPNIMYLEDQLRSSLGTKVEIYKRSGKGKLSIEFYSDEELSALVDKLSS